MVLGAVTIVATVWIAVFTLGRQHRNTLEIQRDHLRQQLQLEIFNEISHALAEAATRLGNAVAALEGAARQLDLHVQGLLGLPEATTEKLSETHREGLAGMTEVIRVLERYEIVFYHYRSARFELSAVHLRLVRAFSPVHAELSKYLPIEFTGGRRSLMTPDSNSIEAIDERVAEYGDAAGRLQGYIMDLQIEAQNTLLAGLFDNRRVPPRNPLDSTVKVLKADAADEPWDEREPGRFV